MPKTPEEEAAEEALIQAAQKKLLEIRATRAESSEQGKQPSRFSNDFDGLRPNGTCRKCRGPLPVDRFYVCVACEVETERLVAEDAAKRKAERIASYMQASGLPLAYRNGQRGFADVRSAEGTTFARGLLDGHLRGMYLFGDAGEDKTTLACATLAELIRSGMEGKYVNASNLLMEINATYGDNATGSRHALVTPLIGVQALVIDDLGKEKGSEHSGGVIYQILDGRYSQLVDGCKRVLIVVSNFTPADAAARFRDSEIVQPILRRLSELATPLNVTR